MHSYQVYNSKQATTRAKALSKLVAGGSLSPSGADWVTLRLDPYHDFERPIDGYPDADAFDTVVSVRNYEYNVSKPAGAAGNWDAHVFTLPVDAVAMSAGTCTSGQFVQTAETYTLGLVNVAKNDSGAVLFPTAVPVASANFSMAAIDNFNGIEFGLSRVIGMGLEIIDTTAELYKQGAATSYKMPCVTTTTNQLGYLNTAGTLQTQLDTHTVGPPPSSVAQAVLFRNSKQWEAKEGCYMVVGQQGVDNKFVASGRHSLTISSALNLYGTVPVLTTDVAALTALQAPPIMTAATTNTFCKFVNVTQSGVILSGLHNDATFKVRVRLYVERAPLRGETDLIPLASPSAQYDPRALALYSEICNMLPIAVPVSHNAAGDWWRAIARVVAQVAPIIGSAIPIPEAKLIGTSIGSAANAVANIPRRKKKQQKKNAKK